MIKPPNKHVSFVSAAEVRFVEEALVDWVNIPISWYLAVGGQPERVPGPRLKLGGYGGAPRRVRTKWQLLMVTIVVNRGKEVTIMVELLQYMRFCSLFRLIDKNSCRSVLGIMGLDSRLCHGSVMITSSKISYGATIQNRLVTVGY